MRYRRVVHRRWPSKWTLAIAPRRYRSLRILLLAATLGASACGDPDDDTTCVDPPTFVVDIQPIAARVCVSCHAEGAVRRGAPIDLNFDSLEAIRPVVDRFADAITSGRMPPVDFVPGITGLERAITSEWRACGFVER